jgi:hypothetical protein
MKGKCVECHKVKQLSKVGKPVRLLCRRCKKAETS